MRRQNLDIHPIQAALCQMIDQVQEGQLRSVGFEMKHALTDKAAAGIDAVDPASQATVMPDLHTMSMAQTVKLQIRDLHFKRDPGTSLTAPRNLRAQPDDIAERAVDREGPTFAQCMSSHILEAFRNMKAIELQD